MDHYGSKKEPCDLNADSFPDFKVLPYSTEPNWLDAHADKKNSPTSDTIPITLNASAHWTYCSPLLTLEELSLPSSFHTWAQATINGSLLTPLFSFLAYVHDFLIPDITFSTYRNLRTFLEYSVVVLLMYNMLSPTIYRSPDATLLHKISTCE